MPNSTINQARSAKIKLTDATRTVSGVVGVGITKIGASYAVKINLQSKQPIHHLPSEIDGVPVVYDVTGTISSR